jgi:hypothetical protein
MTHQRGRYWRWIVGVVALGCLATLLFWWYRIPTHRSLAKTFDGDSADLQGTVVVPTLDTPFPEGKSAIWCSSFQLAWNQFRSDVTKQPILVQNAEAISQRLNRAEFSTADLAPDTFYAAAGLNKDDVQDKIRAEMAQKFPGVDLPALHANPHGATAFAHLRAAVKFQEPYLVNPESFPFADSRGRETSVISFGIPKSNHEVRGQLREQIEVLYLTLDKSERHVTEFALDLCKHSQTNQIVLASIPRKETLADTLADLRVKMAAFRAALPADPSPSRDDVFDFNDRFIVPTMHWHIAHHFRELEGEDKVLLHPNWRDAFLQTAFQSIDFRLDPEGSTVASSALLEVKSRGPRLYHFNRPFLIVMRKREAKTPFFVMWVDNAELLSAFAR